MTEAGPRDDEYIRLEPHPPGGVLARGFWYAAGAVVAAWERAVDRRRRPTRTSEPPRDEPSLPMQQMTPTPRTPPRTQLDVAWGVAYIRRRYNGK